MSLHGLTRTEASIASMLVQGKTLQEISEHLRISAGTARWNLKNVLHKTETRRQADLVSLLLNSLATIVVGDRQ
jgi:DNA-binding CsgD family transcriptional regulator